jgi:hypothetical protein
MFERFRFGRRRVRISLATELKRVAWAGSAMVALAGWQAKVLWIFMAIAGWWALFMFMAHLLLAMEDEEGEEGE